jgi:hypothetical protein
MAGHSTVMSHHPSASAGEHLSAVIAVFPGKEKGVLSSDYQTKVFVQSFFPSQKLA